MTLVKLLQSIYSKRLKTGLTEYNNLTIRNEFSRDGLSFYMSHFSSLPVIYRIDQKDCLSFVNSEWEIFARKNGTSGLQPSMVLGRPLMDFIQGAETRHLYQLILEKIRLTHRSVEFPFRCDSPDLVRHMKMKISPFSQGIEFLCHTLAEKPRDPVPFFETCNQGQAIVLRMCSWCKHIECAAGEWLEIEEAIKRLQLFHSESLPFIRHGICPACVELARTRFQEE